MKNKFTCWMIRISALTFVIAMLLIIIILNPSLSYANKTLYNNYRIFHSSSLDSILFSELDLASSLLKKSEIYDSTLTFDICLNDGSKYPSLIQLFRGPAFAWGFYNKVVINGNIIGKEKVVQLHGYNWNLAQLLAHELVHCFQFTHLGLWKSKPLAKIPSWKWEGYAEYIARYNSQQNILCKNISRLSSTNKNQWSVSFPDNTIAPKEYYDYWILVQYCMEIKKMTFAQILEDTQSDNTLRQEIMSWSCNCD